MRRKATTVAELVFANRKHASSHKRAQSDAIKETQASANIRATTVVAAMPSR